MIVCLSYIGIRLARRLRQLWLPALLFTTVPAFILLAPTLWLSAGSTFDVLDIATSDGPGQLYLPFLQYRVPRTDSATPVWNSPIARAPIDGSIWAVNPDSGSLSVLDPDLLVKIAEIPVGQEPWSLAFDRPAEAGARLFVLDRAAGELIVVDSINHSVTQRLYVGAEPGALIQSANGNLWITNTGAASIVVVDAERMRVKRTIAVNDYPYALAADSRGTIYVTHFLGAPRPGAAEATDDSRMGQITLLDTATLTVRHTITLTPNATGSANLLAAIALDDEYAWVPHVRVAPALPNSLSTTVFAAVAAINLQRVAAPAGLPDPVHQLSLNDQEIFGSPVNNPVVAIPDAARDRLYVVLAGSNLVEVIDIADPAQPRLVKFLPTGHNPRALLLSPDGRRGYVHNYLSRSISVLDLENLETSTEIPISDEPLAAAELRGKILFHSAVDPRLSQGSWISCASCHPEGGTDGVTWIFPDGPRQTPPLWNATATLPWHWSAALDEAQDVEDTIHIIQHGVGLAPGADPPLLGAPNIGRSADLDALAFFLRQGIRTPLLPLAQAQSPAAISAGRQRFVQAGCVDCHGGPTWTISRLPGLPGTLDPDQNGMVDSLLRDVGSVGAGDLRGATGFDVPTLLNIALTAPYLHDGSMPTLAALLQSGHPDPTGAGNGLGLEEIDQIVAFLHSIGPTTQPIESPKPQIIVRSKEDE